MEIFKEISTRGHEQIAENKILLAKKHKSISIPKSFVI